MPSWATSADFFWSLVPDVFCNSVNLSFVVAAAKEGHFSDPAFIIEHRAVKRAGFWMKTHPGSLVNL